MQLLFCAGKHHNQKQLKEERVLKKRVRDGGEGFGEAWQQELEAAFHRYTGTEKENRKWNEIIHSQNPPPMT